MKLATALAIFAGIAVLPVAAEEHHRQLGAHEHGRGTLNIAVEGDKMTMELETPGMDIVGFEHAAKSRPDVEAVEKAKVQLMRPLALFNMPAAAGCHVIEANVKVEVGEHDHDAKEKPNASSTESSKVKKNAEAESEGHPRSSTPNTRVNAHLRTTSPRSSSGISGFLPAPRSSMSTSSRPRARASSKRLAPSPTSASPA